MSLKPSRYLRSANLPTSFVTGPMARRTILTPAQRTALLALPTDRAELARHYTLSEAELAVIGRRRRARNRLGVTT